MFPPLVESHSLECTWNCDQVPSCTIKTSLTYNVAELQRSPPATISYYFSVKLDCVLIHVIFLCPESRREPAFCPTQASPQPQPGGWFPSCQQGEEDFLYQLPVRRWGMRPGPLQALSGGGSARGRHRNGGERSSWDVFVVCELLSQKGKVWRWEGNHALEERRSDGVRVAVMGEECAVVTKIVALTPLQPHLWEEGSHLSRWDSHIPLVFPNWVSRSRILRKQLDLSYW